MDVLLKIFEESVNLFVRMAPYLLIGFTVSGILHMFVDTEFVTRNLRGGKMSVLKAVILGVPLPVCSCGVIPIAASLKRQGAGKASTLAFLYSTPVTGIDAILATYALLGTAFAIFRPLAAFAGGIFLGLLALSLTREKNIQKPVTGSSSKKSLKDALHYSFVYLPGEIGRWILVGVLLGGIAGVVIPSEIGRYLSNPYFAYPAVLLVSIPVYVCATGSIPVAAALIAKGLTPGAALSFLIAGPATNTVTITFVLKDLGKKFAVLYLAGITFTSVASGLLFDRMFHGINVSLYSSVTAGSQGSLNIASALILAAIIALSIFKPHKEKEEDMKLILKVPGMSCEGCVLSIKSRLQHLDEVRKVSVDLKAHEVRVDTDLPAEVIEKAINDAGYEVKEVTEVKDVQ